MIVVECQLGEGSPEGRDLPGPGSGPDGSGSGSGSGSGGAEAMVELALAESALTGMLTCMAAAALGPPLRAVSCRGYRRATVGFAGWAGGRCTCRAGFLAGLCRVLLSAAAGRAAPGR